MYNHLLPQSFYEKETIQVAKKLLGKYICRQISDILLVGKIVETEAYLPFNDPAAHNYIGKTNRNAILFGEAGYTYVHSLRQYFCLDIVSEGADIPGSILIRALEPLVGIDIMMENRKTNDIYQIASGPGKVCQALEINRDINGVDVTTRKSPIFICDSQSDNQEEIEESIRIGISKAVNFPLRYTIQKNLFTSTKVKSKR